MKKLILGSTLLLVLVLGAGLVSYADSAGALVVPSWDYDHNDNVPGGIDEKGNLIPNIYVNDHMILVDVYGHWAQEAVTFCAEQGYLDGMLSRKYFFGPMSTVPKSELAVFLGRKEKIEYSQYTKDFFSDMRLEDYDLSGSYDYSDWYSNYVPYYVNWAGEAGLLKGTEQGALGNSEFAREHAATIIDRYIAKYTTLYEGVNVDQSFAYGDEDQIANWAKESVQRLSAINLFNGDQNGYFNPKKDISRAEICQIIFNISQRESSI